MAENRKPHAVSERRGADAEQIPRASDQVSNADLTPTTIAPTTGLVGLDKTIAWRVIGLWPGLSTNAKRVGSAAVHHYNLLTGRCDPSAKRLYLILDLGRSTIFRAFDELGDHRIAFLTAEARSRVRPATPTVNFPLLRAVDERWQRVFNSQPRLAADRLPTEEEHAVMAAWLAARDQIFVPVEILPDEPVVTYGPWQPVSPTSGTGQSHSWDSGSPTSGTRNTGKKQRKGNGSNAPNPNQGRFLLVENNNPPVDGRLVEGLSAALSPAIDAGIVDPQCIPGLVASARSWLTEGYELEADILAPIAEIATRRAGQGLAGAIRDAAAFFRKVIPDERRERLALKPRDLLHSDAPAIAHMRNGFAREAVSPLRFQDSDHE